MAAFLDEYMFGKDRETIGFPHLLLCIGIVVVCDDALYGFHSSSLGTNSDSAVAFREFCNLRGMSNGGLGRVESVLSAADFRQRYKDGRADWEREMREFSGLFGYAGDVFGFDTSVMHPSDGAYVEFKKSSGERGGCRISYKRHEKTVIGPRVQIPLSDRANVISYDARLGRRRAVTFAASGVTGRTSLFHKGLFHRVSGSALTVARFQ